MKRFITLTLCLVFLCSLSGCTKKEIKESPPAYDAVYAYTTPDYMMGTIPVTAAKTAYNPLTGESNLATDRVGKRPYMIPIGFSDTRNPTFGLSSADVIVEMQPQFPNESILLGFFSDIREISKIGGLRELAVPLLEFVPSFDPIVVSFWLSGFAYSSDYSDELLAQYPTDALEAFTCRDLVDEAISGQTGPAPAPMNTSGKRIVVEQRIHEIRDETKGTPSFLSFAKTGLQITPAGGVATSVQFQFSEQWGSDLRYDTASNCYQRYHNGAPMTDAATAEQQTTIAFKNVLILFCSEKQTEGLDLYAFDFRAGGDGYYFTNGHYELIQWQKPSVTDDFIFTKKDGAPLVLNPGKTMISVARDSNIDTLQIQ